MEKSIVTSFSELIEQIKLYLTLRMKHYKLSAGEKFIELFSVLTAGMIFWMIAFIIMIFGGFALAFWLGEFFQQPFVGFLIVTGIFVLLILIVYIFRQSLIFDPIARKLVPLFEIEEKTETDE